MKLRVGSMFAGIGGFDLGFERAGFEVVWCIEWDKNAQAVLRKRFPDATIYGDIREVDPAQLARVDVVCGGFPCQDLSVAGKRAGLSGERSGLFHDAMRLVRKLNPKLLVLENVPGLLSSNNGLDFATVLREVGKGWDCEEVAWRVLDSQYFGVAQRRRRVFIVASSSVGHAEKVLALGESVRWHPETRGKARENSATDAARRAPSNCKWWDGGDTAASITTRCHDQFMPDKGNFAAVVIDRSAYNQGQNAAYDPHIKEDDKIPALVSKGPHAVAHAFYFTDGSHGVNQNSELCPPLKVESSLGIPSPPAVAVAFSDIGQGQRIRSIDEPSETLRSTKRGPFSDFYAMKNDSVAIPIQDGRAIEKAQNGLGIGADGDPSYTLDRTGSQSVAVTSRMIVRRLTPVECERLQGFPDGWTQIGTEEKPTADSHRYKQLGNAVTVSVAEWIASRTMKVLRGEEA